MLAGLHLVRHGEVLNPDHVVYADLPGFGLSEAGRRQAEAAARWLRSAGADLVVSSPLQRALETAAVIADALGVEIVGDHRLTEWRLSRRWAGTVWEAIPAVFPGELEAYLDHPHDLAFSPESLAEVAERFGELVEELCDLHPGATVAAVSHQDPIQAARLTLTGRPLAAAAFDKPGHATVITLEPADPWRERSRWDAPVPGTDPFPP